MELVLLTGVSGFIAKHIALKLLNAGHAVRGTLRRLDRADEVRAALAPYLTEHAGELSFVQADLESDAGWADAFQGVTALVHNITDGALQNIIINNATGRDLAQEIDVTLTLPGFELIQESLLVESFGIRLTDDMNVFIGDPGG